MIRILHGRFKWKYNYDGKSSAPDNEQGKRKDKTDLVRDVFLTSHTDKQKKKKVN